MPSARKPCASAPRPPPLRRSRRHRWHRRRRRLCVRLQPVSARPQRRRPRRQRQSPRTRSPSSSCSSCPGRRRGKGCSKPQSASKALRPTSRVPVRQQQAAPTRSRSRPRRSRPRLPRPRLPRPRRARRLHLRAAPVRDTVAAGRRGRRARRAPFSRAHAHVDLGGAGSGCRREPYRRRAVALRRSADSPGRASACASARFRAAVVAGRRGRRARGGPFSRAHAYVDLLRAWRLQHCAAAAPCSTRAPWRSMPRRA
jgi:hypothetical protein